MRQASGVRPAPFPVRRPAVRQSIRRSDPAGTGNPPHPVCFGRCILPAGWEAGTACRRRGTAVRCSKGSCPGTGSFPGNGSAACRAMRRRASAVPGEWTSGRTRRFPPPPVPLKRRLHCTPAEQARNRRCRIPPEMQWYSAYSKYWLPSPPQRVGR